MDAKLEALESEGKELFSRLVGNRVEQYRAAGMFVGVPHYMVIEKAARECGEELSRALQERSMREVTANVETEAKCPTCGRGCRTSTEKRKVASLDGPVELLEAVAHCSACRRDFFPSA